MSGWGSRRPEVITFKLLVVGDLGVGKSSLLLRYAVRSLIAHCGAPRAHHCKMARRKISTTRPPSALSGWTWCACRLPMRPSVSMIDRLTRVLIWTENQGHRTGRPPAQARDCASALFSPRASDESFADLRDGCALCLVGFHRPGTFPQTDAELYARRARHPPCV